MQPTYLILVAILFSLVLMQINQRMASPVLAIVDRWLRWFVFAFGAAQLCRDFELVDRPFWVLAVIFFILWFLGETLYNWLAISALSVSPLPLFPRYVVNSSGEEWPVQPRLLKIRDWLRAHGFKQAQALKAEIGGGIYLRVSIYQNADATVRVQVTFIPQTSGAISVCYAISSVTIDGSRYLTDNLYIPFAGFYPENWFVERAPWRRSLAGLIARHRARMKAEGAEPVPFINDPVVELNDAQYELDRLNTELGFLHPQAQREDFGKITHEGRYRVWKEIWTLNYLGRSARYQ
ncbi:hypothetical protein [Opitutus sp. ER46]|uniref:hypothetical protein n=1 Tax=Opitutus sp. ER46 TaxID=2161864 RepID=UPI000D2F5043|nr:hypothetical protein [Opitutus sp. ER46]PTX98566.1 hypothetical protein DB354_04695 [Opitutus sp. ER46]